MMHEHRTVEQGRSAEDERAETERHASEADIAGFFWYLGSVAAYVARRSPAVSEIVVTKDLDVSSTSLF
jgi:hypothetical protein